MDKPLRKRITFLLKNYYNPNVPESVLLNAFEQESTPTSLSAVSREVAMMKDEGLVEDPGWTPQHWRLTSKGAHAASPLLHRIMIYLAEHWLAIVALVVSIAALLKP